MYFFLLSNSIFLQPPSISLPWGATLAHKQSALDQSSGAAPCVQRLPVARWSIALSDGAWAMQWEVCECALPNMPSGPASSPRWRSCLCVPLHRGPTTQTPQPPCPHYPVGIIILHFTAASVSLVVSLSGSWHRGCDGEGEVGVTHLMPRAGGGWGWRRGPAAQQPTDLPFSRCSSSLYSRSLSVCQSLGREQAMCPEVPLPSGPSVHYRQDPAELSTTEWRG